MWISSDACLALLAGFAFSACAAPDSSPEFQRGQLASAVEAPLTAYVRVESTDASGTRQYFESSPIETVDNETLELATGVRLPEPGSEVRYTIETWAGQSAEDADMESGVRIYGYSPEQLDPEAAVRKARRCADHFPPERVEREIRYARGLDPTPSRRVLTRGSDRALRSAAPGDTLIARVCGPQPPGYDLPAHRLYYDLAVGWGREEVTEEIQRVRAERNMRVAEAQRGLEAILVAHGGRALDRSLSRNCLTVELERDAIYELSSFDEDIARIIVDPPESAISVHEADGESGRHGTQLHQFYEGEDLGEHSPTRSNGYYDLTLGIVDEGFQDKHLAFHDTSSDSPSARLRAYRCTGGTASCSSSASCSYIADLPWLFSGINADGDHGTIVAGIAAADLTDGQDPNKTGAYQIKYSGHANEATLVLYQGDNAYCGNRAAGIRHAGQAELDVLSLSICNGNNTYGDQCEGPYPCKPEDDCDCVGTDGTSDAVNDAFDDGTLVVKAAGNTSGTNNCCRCTVTSPGDAVGALTIGGTMAGCSDDHNDARFAGIASFSAEGGGETGRPGYRSVVDLVAPAYRKRVAACRDPTENGNCGTDDYRGNTNCSSGTSYATPLVAAAAIDFKENWIENRTPASWLDNAGVFKTLMLLMGDRYWSDDDGGYYRVRNFHTRWGGGRLKMRMFDSAGMDSPWSVRSTKYWLEDEESEYVWIGAGGDEATPLPSDVESLKVVMWWKEDYLDSLAANIDLTVYEYQSDCSTLVSTDYSGSYDTKKMFFFDDAGGHCWRVRLAAHDVPYGTGRWVNLAYYWEDGDRDDVDGPDLTCGNPACTEVDAEDIELP